MSGSLFLMPRYLGSDDDKDELEFSSSRKKQKLDNTIEIISNENELNKSHITDSFEKNEVNFESVSRKEKATNYGDNLSKSSHGNDVHQHDKCLAEEKSAQDTNHFKNKNCVSRTSPKGSSELKRIRRRKKRKLNDITDDDCISKSNNFNVGIDQAANQNQLTEKVLYENAIEVNKNFAPIGKIPQKNEVKQTVPNWKVNATCIDSNLESKIPVSEISYLDQNTKSNLEKANISYLFPVQMAVVPWLLSSYDKRHVYRPQDLCVCTPTGSGKTLAYVLPLVQNLRERAVHAIRALIVLPVSELAMQVYNVFQEFIKGTSLKAILLTGQQSFLSEQNSLVKFGIRKPSSMVDIVVATPGRVLDHIYRTKGFCLKYLRYLVVDEADRMMEEIQEGWLKRVEEAIFQDCFFSDCVCDSDIKRSKTFTSAYDAGLFSEPLHKLFFSATLTYDPEQLHSLFLQNPKLFESSPFLPEEKYSGACVIPQNLKMLQVECNEGNKPMIICHLIKQYNFKKVLCFTETIERSHRLKLILDEMGISVREISSCKNIVERKIALKQFIYSKITVLVCSDLVARGIDVVNIDCVILYDAPKSVKTYVHRIGRTARAGKSGTAITLLNRGDCSNLKNMLDSAKIEMPEKIEVCNEDLEYFVKSYQKALEAANFKLRKKTQAQKDKKAQKKLKK